MIAGNTISLVRGLPEMVEKSAKVEKATANGVNDHKKLDEADKYPDTSLSCQFLTSPRANRGTKRGLPSSPARERPASARVRLTHLLEHPQLLVVAHVKQALRKRVLPGVAAA